ncbi:MAG: redoxin domain-containing protein [Chloroflexota bacterium]|nr:redoxin domain-containing protein [Chloroflexota bacterium]MDQ5867185.1 redoxin domain-containing protein [Chloroflexota bacterium]
MRNTVVSAAVVVALGLAIFSGWRMLSGPGTAVSSAPQVRARVGSIAPDFELRDINTGQMVKLTELRGRPVWINFWASWCPPCAEEMPEMQKLYDQYRHSDLALLGIDVQESEEAVRKFTDGKFDWTFLIDADGKVVDRYMVGGLPTHFFIDKTGVIRAIYLGALSHDVGMSHDTKVDFHQYLNTIIAP